MHEHFLVFYSFWQGIKNFNCLPIQQASVVRSPLLSMMWENAIKMPCCGKLGKILCLN